MNQEERRQKRQDEFKHAAVVVTVFVLVLAVMIIGAAAALHKFLPKGTKEVKTPDTQSTEISDDTQTSQNGSDVAEPAVDPLDEQAAQLVSGMSLEDKVAQQIGIGRQTAHGQRAAKLQSVCPALPGSAGGGETVHADFQQFHAGHILGSFSSL